MHRARIPVDPDLLIRGLGFRRYEGEPNRVERRREASQRKQQARRNAKRAALAAKVGG